MSLSLSFSFSLICRCCGLLFIDSCEGSKSQVGLSQHFLVLHLFKFTEIIFIDHQTGNRTYFKRRTLVPITATGNYGKSGDLYGFWDGVGVDNAFSYQLLIYDDPFFTGFFISGYKGCYKVCNSWCLDQVSPYFRTASTDSNFNGVAFNSNGHHPNRVNNRLISVGLR